MLDFVFFQKNERKTLLNTYLFCLFDNSFKPNSLTNSNIYVTSYLF